HRTRSSVHAARYFSPRRHDVRSFPTRRSSDLELRGLRAGDLHLAHVGEVEDADGLADGAVLVELLAVLQGHVPAAEVGEAGAELLVHAVQGGVLRGACRISHCKTFLQTCWVLVLDSESFERRAGAHEVA